MTDLSSVNIETFVTVRPERLLAAFNIMDRMRRGLSLMDPDDIVPLGTTIMMPKGRGSIILERAEDRLVLDHESASGGLRIGLRSHGVGHRIRSDLVLPPEGPLSGHLPLVKGIMHVCETFGRRALKLVSAHDHAGPPVVGPFGEFEPGEQAGIALASVLGRAVLTTRTLVCGTPWSDPTIVYTPTDQLSQMPFLPGPGQDVRPLRHQAVADASRPLVAAIRDWTPRSVIVSVDGTDDSPRIDIVPGSYDMTSPPSDPIARLRLIEALPSTIRDAAGRD